MRGLSLGIQGQSVGLGVLRSAARRRIAYLLRDEFHTNQAAPLPSPRTCEPGPGQFTLVDTNAVLSVANGRLVVNGTSATADRIHTATAVTRQAGRAWLLNIVDMTSLGTSGGSTRIGVDPDPSSGGTACGGDWGGSTFRIKLGVNVIASLSYFGETRNDIAIILRAAGAFFLRRASGDGSYRLAWVYSAGTDSPLHTKIMFNNAEARACAFDDWRILDLAAPWNTDYGIATNRLVNPSAGATTTHTANALLEWTFTIQSGEVRDLSFRRTDDNNRWIVRCDQAGGTVKLIEHNAGVETERSSAAQTWTAGSSYRVVVTADGAEIRSYVANVAKNTYSSASFNASATGMATSHVCAEVVAWPRYVDLPAGI